jgi:hypothetical protein
MGEFLHRPARRFAADQIIGESRHHFYALFNTYLLSIKRGGTIP